MESFLWETLALVCGDSHSFYTNHCKQCNISPYIFFYVRMLSQERVG